MSKKSPNLYIIAGPNGAGKTTFAKEFLPHYAKCENFVNADLIAQGLSPFSPAAAGIKAGRLLLKQINELHQPKFRLSNSCLTEGAELAANSLNSEEISVGCVGCSTGGK